ncbi:MAG: hypothetical protein HQK64_09430 [Desulfamplus sp.]|nr:hypothetical protein [Desulfamplus sp.]MBF0242680.1 hypothetical protein [Desulfamplus sp.]
MKENIRNTMYQLLRDIGDIQGIARTTILSIESFIAAIKELRCSQEEVAELYIELADAIKNSQPKIIPLIHLIERFEKDMRQIMRTSPSIEEIRITAEKSLKEQIELFKNKADKVTQHGLNYIKNGDVIIVHSASWVVTNILIEAKKVTKPLFRVIVLEQNKERTRQLIQALREHDIDHHVTPAHDLSHYVDEANKMFLGALTITSDHKIVAPSGTSGTVSLCHLNNISVHLFANTLHYSHNRAIDQYIYSEEGNTNTANLHFPITTHSHDLIDLELIDHVVTENGETGKDYCPVDFSSNVMAKKED